MLDVRVRLADGDVEVTARLAHRPDLRYSLMSVDTVRPPDPARRRPSAKTR